jgi:hypothetical protein
MTIIHYLVTWDDLSTMGLIPKGTPPTGLDIANKLEIIDNYYVDETAIPFAGYTNDRCPPYESILPAAVIDCTAWDLTGGPTGTDWEYIPCGDTVPTTLTLVSGDAVNAICSDNTFGMNKISGDGTKGSVGPCPTTTTTTTAPL